MKIALADPQAGERLRPGAERFMRRWADLIEPPRPAIRVKDSGDRERPGAERFRRRWGGDPGPSERP
jgi:hypothetical protein